MRQLEIRRPTAADVEGIHTFFRLVITDTFEKEGIAHLHDDIEHEIASKHAYLRRDLETHGRLRYFLIAWMEDRIAGTIEYGPCSSLIDESTGHALKDVIEVGTVLVHPELHGQGIGSTLWSAILLTLQARGISHFCLDSGYRNAQRIWNRKFGEADYVLVNHWGEGQHHMIWSRNIEDTSISFRL
ncbi:GNAT superfamily N-acetyltransferase [Paenibacillus rhizosphaerae]|uniref:GNAT superfamily N-acetyltransferase n=1 Tax=Paenibacillus rhizosphaerae TaxID=297318 RepID=A0A839TLK3_9BACL|nr:GNAT family N-acetyltransferase [Paenibacillus rhizosphaerae]MBB3126610.1 GNAT superfamily N-acetyltransferase [Paenibacillus rhizosphaerae]